MEYAASRKTPNTSLTETHWQAAMDDFLGGMTDAEVARKWGVSNSTVANQRFKRGVYRRDRSGGSVAEMQSVAAERVAEIAAERALREAEAPVVEAAAPSAFALDDPLAACDGVRLVHAREGKAARAEPVALLYEQGRVSHVAGLEALEDQLLLLGAGGSKRNSPDRADALVWALTALMLQAPPEPRIRVL